MYQTIQIKKQDAIRTIILNRPHERNSINMVLIQELLQSLEEAEQDPSNRIIILKGCSDDFCSGMDFKESIQVNKPPQFQNFMNLLRRLTLISRIVIAHVEGKVMAGGIGLVAASDLVIATPNSQFSLPEVLWGLLPCCVTPYLIRRIGFQATYRLSLTAETIYGNEAHRLQLVDVLTSTPNEEIRKQCLRFKRLHLETLRDLKYYFRKMWLINDVIEETAVREITRLTQLNRVEQNLTNYVQMQKFPWEIDG